MLRGCSVCRHHDHGYLDGRNCYFERGGSGNFRPWHRSRVGVRGRGDHLFRRQLDCEHSRILEAGFSCRWSPYDGFLDWLFGGWGSLRDHAELHFYDFIHRGSGKCSKFPFSVCYAYKSSRCPKSADSARGGEADFVSVRFTAQKVQ